MAGAATFWFSFLDGFGMGGLFGASRVPGMPTRIFAESPGHDFFESLFAGLKMDRAKVEAILESYELSKKATNNKEVQGNETVHAARSGTIVVSGAVSPDELDSARRVLAILLPDARFEARHDAEVAKHESIG